MSTVSNRLIDGVLLVEVDNPPVNAASQAVRQGLLDAVNAAEASPEVDAIVIAAAGRTFIAGADVTEFGKPPLEPLLPVLLNRIEGCAKPVAVAWHGTALGGGCEIGLAAHGRIIDAGGQVGLPEVKLGLVPGAGGTQRLPRLIGMAASIDLIGSGRIVGAGEALALGLVDRIAEGDLRESALAFARSLAGQPIRRTGALPPPPSGGEAEAASVLKRARGQIAPGEAARLVRLSGEASFTEGAAEERRTFLALMQGEQARALRHVFFAEREAGKLPGIDPATARPIQRIGVVGAGTMGSGIAVACLDAGFEATVVETGAEALAKGRERIEGLLQRAVVSGRLDPQGREARLARLSMSLDLADLAGADLVIEAVFEDMAVKLDLLARIEPVLKPEAVIATNTSYLDIDAMGDGMVRPERLVGLHFFSPAHVMKLLEIVRARRTAADVLATALAVGKRLKKITVVAGVCDGFIGNRIMSRYRQECEFMLEEGALPREIDAAFEAYGFAMGPFAVSDLAGLDIAWARRKRLAAGRTPEERYVPIADQLCEMGRFGQKTGAGWHLYPEGRRTADPAVEAMVRAHAAATGRPQRAFAAEEIMTRVLAAIVAEGRRILDEGVAARASDIDVVLVHGYGFPAHKGGPMFQAAQGLDLP